MTRSPRSAARPEIALALGQGCLGGIAIERKKRRCGGTVAEFPQRRRAAQPHQIGEPVAQGEAGCRKVGIGREEIAGAAGDKRRIARAACSGEGKKLGDEGLGIERGAGEGRARGEHPRRFGALAVRAQELRKIEDIARIGLRPCGDRQARRLGPHAAQQRQSGQRQRAVGHVEIGDLPRGRIGLALPQQRIDPHRVIVRGEMAAIALRQRQLDRVGHLPAAPRLARGLERLGTLRAGQCEGVSRAPGVRQRWIGSEEAQHLVLRRSLAFERALGADPQDIGTREGGIGEHKGGIVAETGGAARLEDFPARDRIVDRRRLARHEIGAAEILRRGGRSPGSDQAQSQSGSINPWREQ